MVIRDLARCRASNRARRRAAEKAGYECYIASTLLYLRFICAHTLRARTVGFPPCRHEDPIAQFARPALESIDISYMSSVSSVPTPKSPNNVRIFLFLRLRTPNSRLPTYCTRLFSSSAPVLRSRFCFTSSRPKLRV